jgi:hypothetical protein
MKHSKVMSSYNAVSILRDLIEVREFQPAEVALTVCQSLNIKEVPFFLGGEIDEGSKLYDGVKDFAQTYNLKLSEQNVEGGVLYKLHLNSK